MQVADLCAVFIGKGNAVAGGDFGIGGEAVDPSDTAGCQQHEVAVICGKGAALHDVDRETGAGLFHAHHHSVFQNGDIGQGLDLADELVQNLCAGGILVVEDAVAAVTALQCPVQLAVRRAVEIHAHVQNCLNLVGSVGGQNVQRLRIVFESAGNHGVMLMQFNGILRGLVYTGNSALRQCGVA